MDRLHARPFSLNGTCGGGGILCSHLVGWREAVRRQSVPYFMVRLRIADAVYLGVEGQHPASLAAVVAAPHVLLLADTQLAAAVAAERAVCIDVAGPFPPDGQAEKGNHVHDGEREIRRMDAAHSFLWLSQGWNGMG